jgi:hypothetical protein
MVTLVFPTSMAKSMPITRQCDYSLKLLAQ